MFCCNLRVGRLAGGQDREEQRRIRAAPRTCGIRLTPRAPGRWRGACGAGTAGARRVRPASGLIRVSARAAICQPGRRAFGIARSATRWRARRAEGRRTDQAEAAEIGDEIRALAVPQHQGRAFAFGDAQIGRLVEEVVVVAQSLGGVEQAHAAPGEPLAELDILVPDQPRIEASGLLQEAPVDADVAGQERVPADLDPAASASYEASWCRAENGENGSAGSMVIRPRIAVSRPPRRAWAQAVRRDEARAPGWCRR